MNNIQGYKPNYNTRGSDITWITLTTVRNALKQLYHQKKFLRVIFAYIYESCWAMGLATCHFFSARPF